MATRARIGIELPAGAIVSAYHHWDGYPSGLGRKLVKKFNTEESVRELIDDGDMSSIGVPYSDRGEDCPPSLSDNFQQFIQETENCGGEYAYLFKNSEWVAYQVYPTVKEVEIPMEKEQDD